MYQIGSIATEAEALDACVIHHKRFPLTNSWKSVQERFLKRKRQNQNGDGQKHNTQLLLNGESEDVKRNSSSDNSSDTGLFGV